jgi:two-component sensor histidine kinase
VIADNGIGLPKDFSINNSSSLGLKLVTNLTKQLAGQLSIEGQSGTRFQILFKES